MRNRLTKFLRKIPKKLTDEQSSQQVFHHKKLRFLPPPATLSITLAAHDL
jgi:hypothetical protein